MSLGDASVGWMTTCTVGLVVVAVMAGCSGSPDRRALSGEDLAKRAAVVAPTTPEWDWPNATRSSSPYTKDKGGDQPPTNDPLVAKLYRQLRGIDSIASAGSRWEDESKLAHLVVERFGSPANAHSAMRPYREFAHSYAARAGAVSDVGVRDLGDEAWRVLARGYNDEVTYKWRRGDLVLEAHIQCLTVCRSDVDEAARAWVDAIDVEARRPGA